MSHALPCLAAEAGRDQFVVAPHRAIEEDQRGAGKPGLEIVSYAGASREKVEILARRTFADAKSKRVAHRNVSGGMDRSFQIPRAFAGNGERQDLDARSRAVRQSRLERLVHLDRLAPHILLVQHVEDAVGLQDRKHFGVGIDREWPALAHQKKAWTRTVPPLGGDPARAAPE